MFLLRGGGKEKKSGYMVSWVLRGGLGVRPGKVAPRLRKNHPGEVGGCDKYKVWRRERAWLVRQLK